MSINHQEKVTNFVAKMLEDDFYHDVTIVCDNGEVKANKVILCASSKYFSGLFNNNVLKSEDANDTIPVPTTQDAMEIVIKYLYTGKIESKEFTLKEILDLLKLLELMGEGDLFSEVESFILNKIRNKEFSHEKLLLNASTSEKFKFENITEVVLNLIRDNVKEIANLSEVKYLTSSLMEKLIVVHKEESGDFDYDEHDDEKGRKKRKVMTANEDGDSNCVVNQERDKESIDSTNYVDKFKTFVNWLSGNNNCNQEFKEKMVNLFKLDHFTSSELSNCVILSPVSPPRLKFLLPPIHLNTTTHSY